jgi:hypothetical protein
MTKKSIDEFIQQFLTSLPPQLQNMKNEVEKELRRGLEATFHKLELVTRQEFDIQTQVLAKTRDKLEELEKKVALLEALPKE